MTIIPIEYMRLLGDAVEAACNVIDAREEGREPDPADLALLAYARRRLPEMRAAFTGKFEKR